MCFEKTYISSIIAIAYFEVGTFVFKNVVQRIRYFQYLNVSEMNL